MTTNFETAVQQETAYLKAVHPTPADIPSCSGTADSYFRCHLLPSQLRSVYRFGERAQCTRLLEDWKWCMSVNRLSAEQKREEWIRRRAQWWARRRLGRSSEDVWEYRTELLQEYPKPIGDTGVQIPISSPCE
ncbi:hypothetical protein EXIGLDRAFT_170984 [Exidia glandulosa HHB12029]|uniref:Uncharacterized protein n=1 Tax=Exidia glandulosa HHB12029 TaxID=1314781 RepID=A0A165FAX4_EXIGL|nr:hypothetical protein EXIGLDRAFT_170984 [Exidia glandulosa HHB12029]